MSELFRGADRRSTSIIAYAECRAAIAAAVRSGRLLRSDARKATRAFDVIWPALDRFSVSEKVVHDAGDLADRRSLGGFDAIHLASALLQAPDITIASWDDRLSEAAQAEGISLARSRRGK